MGRGHGRREEDGGRGLPGGLDQQDGGYRRLRPAAARRVNCSHVGGAFKPIAAHFSASVFLARSTIPREASSCARARFLKPHAARQQTALYRLLEEGILR